MADSIFGKVIDFLNTPVPGTASKKAQAKQAEMAKAQAAEQARPAAVPAPSAKTGGPTTAAAKAAAKDQVKAPDIQAELRRRALEIQKAQAKAKEDSMRRQLEAQQKELEALRRKMETEMAQQAQAHAEQPQWTYTVVRGDTLSHIAKRYYGNAGRWPEIFEANKDKIKNPNLIYPGQVLVIPDKK